MKSLKLLSNRTILARLILGALCLLGAGAVLAADPGPSAETQLRDRLRATLLQLRTAESERAALQAAQVQWTDEKSKLAERVEALTKQINANKQTLVVVDGLKLQVERQGKELAQLKEAVETGRQAAEVARTKEAERAKVVEEVVTGLERLVADRQAKNLALYQLANEILQRYEKFGLGDALTAREPFTGITRVKLQNLVQDYQDKLRTDRVTLSEKDLAAYRDKLLGEPGARGTNPAAK